MTEINLSVEPRDALAVAPAASGCCASCSCPPPDQHDSAAAVSWQTWSAIGCGALALAAWVSSLFSLPSVVSATFYATAIAVGGWPLLRGSWYALCQRALDMNVLMTVAVIGACLLGDWGEAASLVVLFTAAEWIEERSALRSRQAITNLMRLAPQRALVRENGGSELIEVDAATVAVGDVFTARAGERIALDGIVTAGSSSINQAPVTGESLPVDKGIGDEVFAGTLNGSGVLEIQATHLAGDGTVARIARLVLEAETQKSPRQRTVETFARRYTPCVFGVALLVATVPPLFMAVAWSDALYRALALLVAACPCAFVLSGPVASICALAAAARSGILVRGGAVLETLAGVRAVAFDKTGTLTQGVPQVTDFVALNGASREQLIALAAGLEAQSRHPLGRAVADFAERESIPGATMENVRELAGQGISGTLHGDSYRIGPVRLFTGDGTMTGRAERIVESLQHKGRSVALLGHAAGPLGVFGMADTMRPGAREVLSWLKALGIARNVILSGDNAAVVRQVAGEVAADSWQSGLLPADKLRLIRELSQQTGPCMMVGDGINDAPALAQADIGVAMGAAGSDVALEAADVALMGDDLRKLPQAIEIARAARAVIVQNIVLALALKFIFVAGLFAGVWGSFSLAGGVIADMGATLLVTANALRLARLPAPYSHGHKTLRLRSKSAAV